MGNFKAGDNVFVCDWSYMIQVAPLSSSSIGCFDTGKEFEVVNFLPSPLEANVHGGRVQYHDVYIQCKESGFTYLHTSRFLKPVKAKEVTMAEVERAFGCKVKIVKE